MSTSWAPDETASELWVDRITLVGVEIGNIAYGVHMTLFIMCFSAWWSARSHSPKTAYIMLAFISCIFILGTIGNGTQMKLLQVAYVDERNFPGGPGAFETLEGSIQVSVIGTAAYSVAAWFSDGLLLYRFFMLWSTTRHRWVVLPALLTFLLSIISASILLAQIADPGGTLWISSSANMALTFWSSSISVTCYCTIFIVGRLLYMRHQIRRAIGTSSQLPYFSVAAMVTESAMLYTAFAFAFLITYASGNSASLMLISILGQVQSIAPLLIVLRVAQGRGWTVAQVKETKELTSNPRGVHSLRCLDPMRSKTNASTTVGGSADLGGIELSERSTTTLAKTTSGVRMDRVVDFVADFPTNGASDEEV
ncbi:hypothetical protein PsYK624_117980 [Phanerochaete sordida]|uniref:Uncharacterized protein n=1 Tax=Phanerochaete sordida TaxID=48140 RepID=A0A9P3GIB8_9APHY|nr:hypothetical protein PsYK624_117980 [Phanerochaete sordida]